MPQGRVRRILAIDPRGYRDGAATADAPFALPPADDQLFAPSLEQVLDDQRAAGADVALTPMKFFQPGDAASLKAAARTAADLDRDDTIFSVPVSIAWLNSTEHQPAHRGAVEGAAPQGNLPRVTA